MAKKSIYPFIEEEHVREGGYVKDIVLGMNDGLVSILSLVTGVAAAATNGSFIVLAGVAGALAGALSMGFGTYISNKSQIEFFRQEFEREKDEIEHKTKKEIDEIRVLYRAKGFRGKLLDDAVKTITSDKERWLRVMMLEELGLAEERFVNPLKAATANFIAFIIGSLVPLVPYFFVQPSQGIMLSFAFTLAALFLVGAIKSKFTGKVWWRSGLEMVAIGAAAAAVTFIIGNAVGVQV